MHVRKNSLVAVLMLVVSGAYGANTRVEEAALRGIVVDPAHTVAPGCAVGVFRDTGDIVTAAGFADVESRRPINGETLFYAASVSKQFTALAIAQLAVAGRLRLDDDVRKYVPKLPEYQVPVTIAMLLHHTSGIRDWIGLMQLAGRNGAAHDAENVALQLLYEQKSTNFVPGTQFLYSNGAFLLLAEVVERVSGQPFHQYEKEHVLDPMGMTSSFFLDGAGPDKSVAAHGYVPKGDGFAVRDTYPRFGGSGGLMVTMNDLARYYNDISAGHKVWTPAVTKVMLDPGKFTDGAAVKYQPGGVMGYAAGLAVGQRRGQFMVQHGGAADGFKNEFGWFPQAKLGVGILCNRGDWDPLDRFDAVVEQVRPGFLSGIGAEGLRGLYHSDELSADYVVEPDGDDLRVTIVPRSGDPSTTMMMHHGKDAGYRRRFEGRGMWLEPDVDGKGIIVGTDRSRDIRLTRLVAN